MPVIKCPIDLCTCKTDDVDVVVAAALLNLHATTHMKIQQPNSSVKKPDRPKIDLAVETSEAEWALFCSEWDIYKTRSGIKNEEITLELRAACTTELRRALYNFIGQAKLSDEPTIKAFICQMAVKGKNTAVHRHEFYSIAQSAEEPIQSFVGKLRKKASLCHFVTTCLNADCETDIFYNEAMITDQMVVGLYDKECQGEVLSKDIILSTFDMKFDLIQALEAGRQAESLLNTSAVSAHHSAYKKEKKSLDHQQIKSTNRSGCGSRDHGRGTKLSRNENCPYWGVTCTKCNKQTILHPYAGVALAPLPLQMTLTI